MCFKMHSNHSIHDNERAFTLFLPEIVYTQIHQIQWLIWPKSNVVKLAKNGHCQNLTNVQKQHTWAS